MKYSIIFAATAAAYDGACLTTVTPGYGKPEMPITAQHQAYPTCVQKGYDGKSCEKWGEDAYVSTHIKDYNGKDVCVTKTDQPITVYYEKKTITHTATAGYGGYATPAAGYAHPTSGPEYKIKDDGCWYELYEKVETAPYNKLGAHALKGYPGSGLCKEEDNEQHVKVKEYKNGKWSNYESVHNYGKPEAYATTYATPGIYTVPAKTVTCDSTVYYAAETTRYGKAGETCTYGGKYINAESTGYLTAGYAAYETGSHGEKNNVLKYSTIYVTKTGPVEVCKPTTTVWDKDTSYVMPTASYYKPGVYHYKEQVVTVTSANQPYTCPYEKWTEPTAYPKKPVEGDKPYSPAYPTSYPNKPVEGDKPYYPVGYNNTAPYPTGKAYAAGYPSKPVTPAGEEDCDENGYPKKPVEGEHGKPYPAKPVQPGQGYPPSKPVAGETPYPAKPVTPAGEEDCDEYGNPKKPVDSTKGTPYPAKPVQPGQGYPPAKPVEGDHGMPYPAKPVDSTQGKPYPAKPVEGDHGMPYPAKPVDSTQGKPYPAQPVDSTQGKPYPAKPVSPAGDEDCDEEDSSKAYKPKPYHPRRHL